MLITSIEPVYDDELNAALAAFDSHEHRIYGHENAQIWAIVDYDDYLYFQKWRWCIKRDPYGKEYMRRAVGENSNGVRLRTYTIYLHVAIMERAGILPPSKFHKIVDHRNGKSLDCRKRNLRWATHSINSRNRFGSHERDLLEG